MLHIEDFQCNLKGLRGAQVETLQVMSATFAGDDTPDAQWMLLKLRQGHWHRFFLDVGVLFWQEQRALTPEDQSTLCPDPARTLTLLEVPQAARAVLAQVVMTQEGDDGVLTLAMEDGRCLEFRNTRVGADDEVTLMTWTAAKTA